VNGIADFLRHRWIVAAGLTLAVLLAAVVFCNHLAPESDAQLVTIRQQGWLPSTARP
jgi:hypothetical protein